MAHETKRENKFHRDLRTMSYMWFSGSEKMMIYGYHHLPTISGAGRGPARFDEEPERFTVGPKRRRRRDGIPVGQLTWLELWEGDEDVVAAFKLLHRLLQHISHTAQIQASQGVNRFALTHVKRNDMHFIVKTGEGHEHEIVNLVSPKTAWELKNTTPTPIPPQPISGSEENPIVVDSDEEAHANKKQKVK